jgi:hypothetical protein
MRTYRTGRNLAAALAAAALIVPGVEAAQLSNISVGRSQDFTVVTLSSDADVAVSHQAIEAKSGKPDRIVIDLTGVEHALPRNNFDQLPAGSLTRIRTSQFAVSPAPVVRVVLDLAVAAPYKVETEGHNVRVMVSLPSDPPMADTWTATGTPVLAQEPSETSTPDAASPMPVPMPLVSNEPSTPSQPTEPATVTVDEPTPAVDASTSGSVAALEPLPPATGPESPDVPLPMPKHRPADVIDFNMPGSGAPASTQPESTPALTNMAATADAPAQQPAEESAALPNATETPVAGPEMATTYGPSPENATPESPSETTAMDSPSETTATESPSGNTATTGDASAPANESENAPAGEAASAPTESAPAESAPAESAPAESNSQPQYAAGEEGSLPVASLSTLPPMEPGVPEVVPQRNKIVYHTNGRRDPFRPLLQVGAGYNSASLPDVASLRLVGLLHDMGAAWGLFQDANGYGYILREGDRVKNGRLNKLTNTRAYFQLNEFGWSRSVELELEPEG